MIPSDGWGIAFVILIIVSGIVGWVVIEFILWALSFVHIRFG